MKMTFQKALILTAFMAFSAVAQDFLSDTKPSEPPDKEKLSYALGMRLGLQLKQAGADVDPDVIAQAIKDVLEGKPTKIQESEIRPLMMQAQAYGAAKKAEKNKAASDAFLAKNAKTPGVTVLPDGLQYRIIQTGTGEIPKSTDLITLNLRGNLIDGTEFRRKDHLQIPFAACPKACQEALQLMKAGSKWQIFAPSELAYGYERRRDPGTETTLVYELELISAEPESAHPGEHHGGGRLGHPLDEDFFPPKAVPATTRAVNTNSGPQSVPVK
jgi:FKBP-type peptidyl-prolyl cis-trans isomerase